MAFKENNRLCLPCIEPQVIDVMIPFSRDFSSSDPGVTSDKADTGEFVIAR